MRFYHYGYNPSQFDFDQLAEAFKSALVNRLPKSEDIQPIESSRIVDRESLLPEELERLFNLGNFKFCF